MNLSDTYLEFHLKLDHQHNITIHRKANELMVGMQWGKKIIKNNCQLMQRKIRLALQERMKRKQATLMGHKFQRWLNVNG